MFVKTHGIHVLDLSGTQHMTIALTGTVRLECTFSEKSEETIALISIN